MRQRFAAAAALSLQAEVAHASIMRASHAWIAAYAVTGALQPLLVDRLKQQGLAPARLLGPMMANLLGMTLVAPAREACVGSPAPIAQTVRASWRPLAAAAASGRHDARTVCAIGAGDPTHASRAGATRVIPSKFAIIGPRSRAGASPCCLSRSTSSGCSAPVTAYAAIHACDARMIDAWATSACRESAAAAAKRCRTHAG